MPQSLLLFPFALPTNTLPQSTTTSGFFKIQMKGWNNFVETKDTEKYASDYQRQVRYQFESFCKKVIHSERCDYLRWLLRHTEKETNFSALPVASLDRMGHTEDWQNDPYIFNVCGYSIPIQEERLVDSLLKFDDMERSILLLSYALRLSDQATGKLLGILRSRVNRLKPKLLAELRKKMKE